MASPEPTASNSRRQQQSQSDSPVEGSEGDEDLLVPEQQGSPHKEGAAAEEDAPAEEAAYGKSSLTKAVLEAHFIYSLSEAARRLGVSNTTVKRACR